MATLAGTADVDRRYKLTAVDDLELAEDLLVAASAMVRSRIPDVDARIVAATLDADLVRHVVAEMVARVLRNPDGATSTTTGPFGSAYPGPFGLRLDETEIGMLMPATTGSMVGTVGTVSLGAALGYPSVSERRRAW